jgi:hypothetical protein
VGPIGCPVAHRDWPGVEDAEALLVGVDDVDLVVAASAFSVVRPLTMSTLYAAPALDHCVRHVVLVVGQVTLVIAVDKRHHPALHGVAG